MSSRVHATPSDEIARYIDGLREQKRVRQDALSRLEEDRRLNGEQLERVKLRLETIDENIARETEKIARVEQAIERAENTYAKLKESSQNLMDFLKKEYQDLKEPSRSQSSRESLRSFD